MKRVESVTPERSTRRYLGGDIWERLRYRVEIDQDALDQMARKAAASRSGTSKDGAVTVTITEAVTDNSVQPVKSEAKP